jgi:hypothetical protein
MPTYSRRGRQYRIDGAPVLSVTTILDKGFPSKALMYWAANETATAAVNDWDELAQMDEGDRFDRLRRAPWEKRDKAALRGTDIHEFGHRIALGESVDVPEALAQPVAAYARWLDEFDVSPVVAERPVFHPQHGWAGTPDLLAEVTTREYGRELWLLDIKTGKGVYESHVLQIAAYRHAVDWLAADGTVSPYPYAERTGAIHVTPDSVELIEVTADERAYKAFRHAHQVALFCVECEDAFKERRAWPVGYAVNAKERVSHAG